LQSVVLTESTCGCLASHAARQPMAIAVVHGGVGITYRVLANHVLAAIGELSAAGLDRPGILGVEVPDRYVHLLILLAAEALGIPTISLLPSELEPPADLGRLCDRLIISRPIADPAKAVVLTPDWVASVFAQSEDDRPLDGLRQRGPPDALLRLMKTSGTTGAPKVMGMSSGLLQRQISKLLRHAPAPVTSHPDFLCLYNFSVRAAYTRSMLALQLAGTIRFSGADVLWDTITAGIGNYVLFTSGDLERFVRAAPYNRGPFAIHIDVMGGAVSPRLRQEMREKLTSDFQVNYSSNETHHISLVGDDDVGTLYDDVRVRIVDDHGKPVKPGQPGVIRVKTATMIDGYFGAPELDNAAFIDGWYHTNDFGYQPSGRTLVVLGRADDMLNLGGVKVAPAPIEHQLRSIEGVHDALVTSLDDNLETNLMLVAIALLPNADRRQISTRSTAVIRRYVPHFQLLLLSALPRTESGKIRREAVKDLYRGLAVTL
jgi:acyl-coenzyme A synthetase/AMP-(fatty) acid ligase